MAADRGTFGDKMGDWFRHILSCCDKQEAEEERAVLQISGPTNFRREDISIPGIDPEHQQWIREKAIADAQKMWDHLQPLRSSPSGQFADPANRARLPTYEEFTTPRSAPVPASAPTAGTTTGGRTSMHSARRVSGATAASQATTSPLERIRAHGRKISSSLGKKPAGVGTGTSGKGEEGSPVEMRSLIGSRGGGGGGGGGGMSPPLPPLQQQQQQQVGSPRGKLSGESFSEMGGSDAGEGDKDSAKAGFEVGGKGA